MITFLKLRQFLFLSKESRKGCISFSQKKIKPARSSLLYVIEYTDNSIAKRNRCKVDVISP